MTHHTLPSLSLRHARWLSLALLAASLDAAPAQAAATVQYGFLDADHVTPGGPLALHPGHSFNSTGGSTSFGSLTCTASNSTLSVVTVPQMPMSTSSAFVTAVGHDNAYCSVYGWTAIGGAMTPSATCFDAAGNPRGAPFTMTLLTTGAR